MPAKKGLYENIHAKRKRIEAGSGEKMRKPGAKGAPSASDFKTISSGLMISKLKFSDIILLHPLPFFQLFL